MQGKSQGRQALMWMKAEPAKGPHSCPAGLAAPLAGSVQLSAQHQGKDYPSLAEARPRQREQRSRPLSLQSQGSAALPDPRVLSPVPRELLVRAGVKDTALAKK